MKFMARTAAISAVVLLAACGGGGSSGGSTAPPVQAPAPTPAPTPTPTAAKPPNVVFIVADDLNLYVEGYGGHPQAYTPNLKRLMARGVTFRNAQANGSICSPSRASFLSGYLPATSGKDFSDTDFRSIRLLSTAKLLPEHFRDEGYAVYGAGKVFHDTEKDNRVFGTIEPTTHPNSRTSITGGYVGPESSFGPYPWDGITREFTQPSRNIPWGTEGVHWRRKPNDAIEILSGGRWNNNPSLPNAIQRWSFGFGRLSHQPVFKAGMNSTYPFGWAWNGWADFDLRRMFTFVNSKRSQISDEMIGDWATALLTSSAQPDSRFAGTAPIDGRHFLLMVGLTKTHAAQYLPDDYYAAVIAHNNIRSVADVALPPAMKGSLDNDDLADIPPSLLPKYQINDYNLIMSGGREGGLIPDVVNAGKMIANSRSNLLRSMILSYLAGVYEVDVQVGRILDAIDANPALRDNTIIVFTSDQGYHLGEKMAWNKGTLWNQTFNIPLVIVDPRSRYDDTRGKVSTAPVSLVDLFPTLLELTGIGPVPLAQGAPALDGQSVVPALANPESPAYQRLAAALSSTYAGYLDSQPHNPAMHNYSLRTQRYRYIVSPKGEEELYDYDNDPLEYYNVANDPAYASAKAELNAIVHQRAGF